MPPARSFPKWLPLILMGMTALLMALACALPPALAPALPPTPTPLPIPTATAAPAPTAAPPLPPAFTPAPPAPPPPSPAPAAAAVLIPRLVIAPPPAALPDYDRKDWKHWIDADRDCRNTRAEVLIAEAAGPVTFVPDKECVVAAGEWPDPFTGETFTAARQLDVDHLVPLANAHRSGGWQWDAARKRDFANSLDYANHLLAVAASANRAKGARGPEEWRPPNAAYHCQYARDWIAVKAEWDLTATAAEWAALAEMLAECPYAVAFAAGDGPGSGRPPPPEVQVFNGSLTKP